MLKKVESHFRQFQDWGFFAFINLKSAWKIRLSTECRRLFKKYTLQVVDQLLCLLGHPAYIVCSLAWFVFNIYGWTYQAQFVVSRLKTLSRKLLVNLLIKTMEQLDRKQGWRVRASDKPVRVVWKCSMPEPFCTRCTVGIQ